MDIQAGPRHEARHAGDAQLRIDRDVDSRLAERTLDLAVDRDARVGRVHRVTERDGHGLVDSMRAFLHRRSRVADDLGQALVGHQVDFAARQDDGAAGDSDRVRLIQGGLSRTRGVRGSADQLAGRLHVEVAATARFQVRGALGLDRRAFLENHLTERLDHGQAVAASPAECGADRGGRVRPDVGGGRRLQAGVAGSVQRGAADLDRGRVGLGAETGRTVRGRHHPERFQIGFVPGDDLVMSRQRQLRPHGALRTGFACILGDDQHRVRVGVAGSGRLGHQFGAVADAHRRDQPNRRFALAPVDLDSPESADLDVELVAARVRLVQRVVGRDFDLLGLNISPGFQGRQDRGVGRVRRPIAADSDQGDLGGVQQAVRCLGMFGMAGELGHAHLGLAANDRPGVAVRQCFGHGSVAGDQAATAGHAFGAIPIVSAGFQQQFAAGHRRAGAQGSLRDTVRRGIAEGRSGGHDAGRNAFRFRVLRRAVRGANRCRAGDLQLTLGADRSRRGARRLGG